MSFQFTQDFYFLANVSDVFIRFNTVLQFFIILLFENQFHCIIVSVRRI